MGDIFKGWRRKIGVLTLVLACAFMIGWVRSVFCEDVLTLINFPRQWAVDSLSGHFGLFTWENPEDRFRFAPIIHWDRFPMFPAHESVTEELIQSAVNNSSGYFGRDVVSHTIISIVVPYWSIVLSLTALSAFLLLAKPGQPAQRKTAEPMAPKLA